MNSALQKNKHDANCRVEFIRPPQHKAGTTVIAGSKPFDQQQQNNA